MTTPVVALDTDAASRAISGRIPPSVFGSVTGRSAITFVTVGELTQGAVHAGWGSRRTAVLDRFVAAQLVLPYDDEVARLWGRIRGAAPRSGRPRPANDVWVAACCIAYDLPLLTFNTRDYDGIPGLALVEVDAGPTSVSADR